MSLYSVCPQDSAGPFFSQYTDMSFFETTAIQQNDLNKEPMNHKVLHTEMNVTDVLHAKPGGSSLLIPENALSLLNWAFQVDPLFVRTFVASLDLTPLLPVLISGKAPVDVMAAALAHHIGMKKSLEMKHRMQIGVCLNMMISKLKGDKKKLELGNLKEVTCKAEIIKDLYTQVFVSSHTLEKDIVLNATFLMFLALDHVALVEDEACLQNEGVWAVQSWRRDIVKMTEDICSWLSYGLSSQYCGEDVLKMWDSVLSNIEDDMSHAGLKQTLKDLLSEGFEKKMSMMGPDRKLEIYLAQYTMAPAFADILNRLAFEALDAAFQTESRWLATENVRLASLPLAFIEQNWREQVKNEEDVLKFVITWHPMVNYFNRFGKETDNKVWTPLATQNIRRALDCVKNLLDSLRDGSILIKNLRLVISFRERFVTIAAAANHDRTLVSALLDLRQHELNAYISAATHLDRVLDYCLQFLKTGDLQEVQRNAEELRDRTDKLSLADVVDIALPDSIQDLKTYNPTANPWKLPDSIYKVLPVFGDRMSSYIFQKLFSSSAENVDLSTVTLWRAFQVVWDDTSKEWKNLCQQMIDGTVTLADTEKVFSMFRSQDGSYRYDEIANELRKLDPMGSGQWVDERIEQFRCFKEHVKGASVLLKVREAYSIEGNFGYIETIFSLRHIVYALRYVPAILSGQRRVMMRFHRRLDRAEAAALSIDEIMSQHEGTGLEELMDNFSKAWEIVKEHLTGFQCVAPIEGVMVSLPEKFHNSSVTKDSPLAMLLPALHGPGLCSYILLQYILGKNNGLLQTYLSVVNQRFESFPEVSVHDITEHHLIGCSPEQDLLPMVLSHCNYNLMVGHAATLHYDFAAFQRQLQDTVLQGKAKVQKSPLGHFAVQTMAYRADTTSSRLFKVVRKKIDQKSLSPAERGQILEDLHDNLPDICQSIDNLNTAVSFLKALGGTPSDSLHDFMTKILGMKHTLYSCRAQQMCSLTHVQSLWIILCYRRACILANHQQDAFDGVETKLNEELTPEQGKEVEVMCQQMSVERLELLQLQLFECIMLHLSEPQSQDDDTRPENFSLRDVLTANMESPLYHVEPVEVRSGLLRSDDLSTFPESLQGRHAMTVWILCRALLVHKLRTFLV